MASYPRKYLLTSTNSTTSDENTEACYMCFVCPDYCTKYILSPSPQFSPPQKLQMSPILIIMLCILGATFLLFSYVIARWRYSLSRSSTERNSPNLQGDHNFMRGNDQGSSLVSHHPSWFIQVTELPRLTIESIGEVRYKRGEALRDCCVCLSEFEEEERLRVLTKCGHAFHVACIDTWLMSHMNCPVCRAPILSADDVSRSNSQQEIMSELLQVENMVNEDQDTIDHDFADKLGIRRSVSVDYLHGSSIQRQQVKRSSSFTGN